MSPRRALLCLCALASFGCEHPPSVSREDDTGRVAAPLPEATWRGVCLAHNWQGNGRAGYGTEAGAQTLDYLVDVGADWVSLTPFGWLDELHSVTIGGEHTGEVPGGGESSARLEGAVAQAKARGVKVMLKPHLWVRGGAWQGHVAPRDGAGQPAWDAWWDSYRGFILYYASFAQRHQLDALVVAIELPSAVGHARGQGLLQTIAAVREVYDGPLLYGANWDEQVAPEVWAALDMVGVQLYAPLSHAPDPDVSMMRAGLRPHLRRWADIARAANKPLVLTEVGYRASPTAASAPYAWPEHQEGAREVDEALQARAYHALFAEAAAHNVRGLFLWKIFTDPHTDEEGLDGFSPRGKAAEAVWRQAYAPAP